MPPGAGGLIKGTGAFGAESERGGRVIFKVSFDPAADAAAGAGGIANLTAGLGGGGTTELGGEIF